MLCKNSLIWYTLKLFDSETSTYTYIIGDGATLEAVIIDPVKEKVDRDLDVIRRLGLNLKYACKALFEKFLLSSLYLNISV